MERGNLGLDAKGEVQVEAPLGESTDARHRGGLARSSYEADESQWSEGAGLSVLLVSQLSN